MANNTPVSLTGLPRHSCKLHLQLEDRFRFTPVKALKPAPRLWDRKPSTPLAARGSRKLWKRFQSSFNNMKSLGRSSSSGLGNDGLDTEINGARNGDYVRGVKRRCFGIGDGATQERGRSFLETKWELEITRKRRKLPAENWNATDLTNTTTAVEEQQAQLSDGLSAINDNVEKRTTTPEAVQRLTPNQESKLVRSALRSSLDAEDTALLNDFLSKAQAKRAAKAVVAADDAEGTACPENLEAVCHTPPRAVLRDLDTNSPSPTKAQFSPCKVDGPVNAPVLADPASEDRGKDEGQLPASPANRRSALKRQPAQPSNPPPRVTPPTIRNTGLRRAKGTEFIFRDRNEEQNIEQKTRENTAYNKGERRVKAVLRAFAKQKAEEKLAALECSEDESQEGEPSRSKTAKVVAWRKERFIEYEDGEHQNYFREDNSGDDVTGSDGESSRIVRSARAQQLKESQEDKEPQVTVTPVMRRIRRETQLQRLKGQPDMSDSSSLSSFSSSSSSTSMRKTLTPKSPRQSQLAAPASKKATTKSTAKNSVPRSKRTLTADAGLTPKPKRTRSKT